jgi:replicative DNA helicase
METKAVAVPPPSNIAAERTLIGCLLMDDKQLDDVVGMLKPEHFYDLKCQGIYKTILQFWKENKPLSMIHTEPEMNHVDIITLKVEAPVGSRATHYAKVVLEAANKRQIYKMAQSAQERVFAQETAAELVDSLSDSLTQIGAEEPSEAVTMDSAMALALNHVEAVNSGDTQRIGRSTGYDSLDSYLGGLSAGSLYLIAARPSIGKTALALSMAMRTAADYEDPILLLSLEMSREELSLRLLSQQSRIGLAKIRTGKEPRTDNFGTYDHLTEGNFSAICSAASTLARMPILINDTARVTPRSMWSQVLRLNTKKQLGLIIVDYIQLISATKSGASDYERVSDASRELKLLAKECGCPVIALSQLNRQCEQRTDKKPYLSDLRESGNLEQDADAVMFIYRPGYYGLPDFTADYAEVIVAKQRNGPCGAVPLQWHPKLAYFDELQVVHNGNG